MIVSKYINTYLKIGTDYEEDFYVVDFNNVAIDLTGYTVSAQYSNTMLPLGSINSTLVKNTSIPATISNATTGKISLSISSTNTSTYSFGRYFIQITLTNTASGKKYRAFDGILSINP